MVSLALPLRLDDPGITTRMIWLPFPWRPQVQHPPEILISFTSLIFTRCRNFQDIGLLLALVVLVCAASKTTFIGASYLLSHYFGSTFQYQHQTIRPYHDRMWLFGTICVHPYVWYPTSKMYWELERLPIQDLPHTLFTMPLAAPEGRSPIVFVGVPQLTPYPNPWKRAAPEGRHWITSFIPVQLRGQNWPD